MDGKAFLHAEVGPLFAMERAIPFGRKFSMSSTVRESALDDIALAQPVPPLPAPDPGKSLASGYGRDVFDIRVMRQRLPFKQTGLG